MQIFFEDNELERMASDYNRSVRKLGKRCADVFRLRVKTLTDAHTLADVRDQPGRFHELMGDRKGQME